MAAIGPQVRRTRTRPVAARHVKAALWAMTVKTDRKDARGLAQH